MWRLSLSTSNVYFPFSLQPKDDQSTCVEASNLQSPLQHQAVHNWPGKALPADVGAPQQWQQTRPPGQTAAGWGQWERLNDHTPPASHLNCLERAGFSLLCEWLSSALSFTPTYEQPAHAHICHLLHQSWTHQHLLSQMKPGTFRLRVWDFWNAICTWWAWGLWCHATSSVLGTVDFSCFPLVVREYPAVISDLFINGLRMLCVLHFSMLPHSSLNSNPRFISFTP